MIIEATQSKVAMKEVMDTGLFNLKEATEHPLWIQELNHFEDHKPETEEYGITSFVYHVREPFLPMKIHKFFTQDWPGVLRSKGFFWLSNRPEFIGEVSQAGSIVRHQGLGRWWAVIPKENWPLEESFDQMIIKYWDKEFGDRRQEIVFIGLKGVPEKVIDIINKCLANEASNRATLEEIENALNARV